MGVISSCGVVFDFDGVIVDSESLAVWAWNQVLGRYDRRLDDETFHQIMGLRVADSARLITRRLNLPISAEQAYAERERLFLEAVPTRLRAREGFSDLLQTLEARDIPFAIATSGHRDYVTLALETLGLEGRFPVIVTGDEVAHGKPDPDIYRLAAERLGMASESCIALEDAPLGVESATAAGMLCVAIPTERTARFDFPGAYRVVPSLKQAQKIVLAFCDCVAQGECVRYMAAGGVVVHEERVLLLRRPSRGEVRLPKGHIEPGETARQTALREVQEESGYAPLSLETDLGQQVVTFDYKGRHCIRTEYYFVMRLNGFVEEPIIGEKQFDPMWRTWDEALRLLSFEAEREWVRRARLVVEGKSEGRVLNRNDEQGDTGGTDI